MHHPVAEGFAGGDVEISDDFVDAESAFYTASLVTGLVEVFAVVFSLTLFDALPAPKSPANSSVGVADLVARVAAARFLHGGGGGRAVAAAAVGGVEVGGLFIGVEG